MNEWTAFGLCLVYAVCGCMIYAAFQILIDAIGNHKNMLKEHGPVKRKITWDGVRCGQCGRLLRYDSLFCDRCGRKVER